MNLQNNKWLLKNCSFGKFGSVKPKLNEEKENILKFTFYYIVTENNIKFRYYKDINVKDLITAKEKFKDFISEKYKKECKIELTKIDKTILKDNIKNVYEVYSNKKGK